MIWNSIYNTLKIYIKSIAGYKRSIYLSTFHKKNCIRKSTLNKPQFLKAKKRHTKKSNKTLNSFLSTNKIV